MKADSGVVDFSVVESETVNSPPEPQATRQMAVVTPEIVRTPRIRIPTSSVRV
ncbi:hypothetical protein H7J93_23505 [Mycobacterium barrassiae]|uniref:hypothetical protein n=1 Tax=Mycobacterium barrassiae TaxID=319709 RepID=UPI0022659638|nr:hypothetical protein [Mycobacterium barrassiae]MCV7302596.1 hypothetical protein [Mycobacterium barrassiae]